MKKVFLTGATGFLGGEVLVRLAEDPRIEEVFCLVRAAGEKEGMLRLKGMFNLHGNIFPEGKIFPVIGNLQDSKLAEQLAGDDRLNEIDTVIHSGADTHFTSRCFMEKINVGGTRSVATWAASLKKLQTFMFVGTATICGKKITGRMVFEDESPNVLVDHMVKYTRTKMFAELAVREIIPKNKMVVVRPTSIMGDSRNIKPRDFAILWVLIAINELRLIPSRDDAMIDLVGVDYVADAMHALLFANRKYDTYHISSGPESISNLHLLSQAMNKLETTKCPDFRFIGDAMDELKKYSRSISKGKEINANGYSEYMEYWKQHFGENGKLRIILSCLEDYLKFADQDVVFDNSRLLEDTNIGHPVPAHVYIKNNWPYMKEIDLMQWAQDS